jgi:hypothetical protein
MTFEEGFIREFSCSRTEVDGTAEVMMKFAGCHVYEVDVNGPL